MSKIAFMIWSDFKEKISKYPDHQLQFEYDQGSFVDFSYHITEIKHAPIVSVDCGGKMNSWTEVIVQLWEPPMVETTRSMEVKKAMAIISLVEKSLPLNPLGIVKIEFGNSKFATRQMFPSEFKVEDGALIVSLVADVTQCKALDYGGTCGVPSQDLGSEISNEKASDHIELLTDGANTCVPGGGCC